MLNATASQTGAGRRWSLLRRVPLVIRLWTAVAVPLILLYGIGLLGWPDTAATGSPVFGANVSCKRAEYLGQNCQALLREVLGDLGVRHIRLSAYWSDIEREPGVYDFRAIDELLEIALAYDARVTVSIGMKAQRYPEFWFPTWLRLAAAVAPDGYPEDNERVRAALLPYLDAAARHIGAHPAVEAIQVENEPFVHFEGHANGWRIRKPFLHEEIETVRNADPGRHPIVVSHASWWRVDQTWRWIVAEADVLAQSVYTKRQRGPWPWLYIFPYRIGPFTPDLPGQARAAAARDKQLWILELQAEPYESPGVDPRRASAAELASFSPRWLDANVRLARRSGATRAYLWGVEWWAYVRDRRGEPALWEKGRALFRGDAGAAAGR